MGKIDVIFLFCVLGCAGLFAARTITQSVPLLLGGTSSGSATLGVAGQSREVDMAKLERLLERRALSDHEAEFYEPVGDTPRSGNNENENSEPEIPLEHRSDRTGEN